MKLKITILEGDGVGPEVTREAVRVLRSVAALHGHEFTFDQQLIGGDAIRQTGSPLPTATLERCLAGDAVLLGAVDSPEFDSLKPIERPEAAILLLPRALGGEENLARAGRYVALAS